MPHSPVVTVQYNSSGWNSQLTNAINSQNYISLVIKGSLASNVKGKMAFPDVCMVPAGPVSVPIPYPNLIYSLASLPTLQSLVVWALTGKGYSKIKASFDAIGSGKSDDKLFISLR